MNKTDPPTYSISVRLQRTTTESAFVSVPVTPDIMIAQPDGTGRIDGAKLVQRTIESGSAPGIAWQVEERLVQPHPTQTPPPEPSDANPYGELRRGDLVELDGLLAVVVGVRGDPDVPEDHIAVWFGDPRCIRKSQGGPGGQHPEIWTIPVELLVLASAPIWKH